MVYGVIVANATVCITIAFLLLFISPHAAHVCQHVCFYSDQTKQPSATCPTNTYKPPVFRRNCSPSSPLNFIEPHNYVYPIAPLMLLYNFSFHLSTFSSLYHRTQTICINCLSLVPLILLWSVLVSTPLPPPRLEQFSVLSPPLTFQTFTNPFSIIL